MLVVDANILMRAVLGKRTRTLLAKYGQKVEFLAPQVAIEEAMERLPLVIKRRNLQPEPFMTYFDSLAQIIKIVEVETYSPFAVIARQRMANRDEDDWPILAAALALRCPIWTEDTDFFGCGVATWTTDRIEFYLREIAYSPPLETSN
jgi:predicted nucleic acid-binding protein